MADTAIDAIRRGLVDDVVKEAFNHLRGAFADDLVRRMKTQEWQGVAERETSIRFMLDGELVKWASGMRDEPLPDVVNRGHAGRAW